MLPTLVSFLPILTGLATLTAQGFFTKALGLGVRKQSCSLGLYFCQCGWAGFALLKKDGGSQRPDFPSLFGHPNQWLGLSSWAVSVMMKQTWP